MSKLFAALLASVILSTAAVAADPAREKADFQRRLDSVKTLTAALQRDNDAGTPAVKAALATVDARQKEAEELAALGEYEVAASILDEAYKKLTTTLTKAKSGEGYNGKTDMAGMTGADGQLLATGKLKSDVDRKLTSAVTLLDAAKRADAAKNGSHGKEIAGFEAQLALAKKAAAAGDYQGADKLVDEVLLKEKQLIVAISGGAGRSGAGPELTGMAGSNPTLPPERLKADFERKLMSASALLDAERRFAGGKDNRHQSEIAAHETAIAKARSAAAGGDFAAANQQIDQVLDAEKRLIAATKSDRATADLKTGSAAAEASPSRDQNGMTGEERKEELVKTLRSTTSLRDLLERRSREQGIDKTALLGKIDQLLGEARKLAPSDPRKAQQVAGIAYEAARSGLEELRGK